MRYLFYILWVFILLNSNALLAQPGWYGVGGQLNDISEESLQQCITDPDNFRLQYITIDSSTNLNRLYLLTPFKELALKIYLDKISRSFSGELFPKLERIYLVTDRLENLSGFSRFPSLKSIILVDYPVKKYPRGIKVLNERGIEVKINMI